MKAVACAAAAVAFLTCGVAGSFAQVSYQPYTPVVPSPYGYPVPYGYAQPDEVLGTSPSYAINPDAYGRQPVVTVTRRCQYPDGWNLTDFTRDVNGTPAGLDHTCPVPSGVRGRY